MKASALVSSRACVRRARLGARGRLARAGFTLLEIMLVVSIIMLLLGAGVFFMGDQIVFGQRTRVLADLQTLTTQLKSYEMVNGNLPTSQQGLKALVEMPSADPKPRQWFQQMTQIPKDPWGNEYVFIRPGRKNPKGFDLFSKGKDGQENTADDIGNWESN